MNASARTEARVMDEGVKLPPDDYIVVRPKGRRQTYQLTLGQVAEMVAWRVAKERAR